MRAAEDDISHIGIRAHQVLDVRADLRVDRRAGQVALLDQGLKPGQHKLSVTAIDAAGNRDSSPAIYTWTVKQKKRHAGSKPRSGHS